MLDLEKRLCEAKKDMGDAAAELIAGSFVAPITAFAGTYNFVNSKPSIRQRYPLFIVGGEWRMTY